MKGCLFACTILAQRIEGSVSRTYWDNVVVFTENKRRAEVIATDRAYETYPTSQGYVRHNVSAFQVPDDFILGAARNIIAENRKV